MNHWLWMAAYMLGAAAVFYATGFLLLWKFEKSEKGYVIIFLTAFCTGISLFCATIMGFVGAVAASGHLVWTTLEGVFSL